MHSEDFSFKNIIKLLTASLILGVAGGTVGAAFSRLIELATVLRSANGWLLCFLPFCGVVIVFLYQKFGLEGVGTNAVLKAACENEKLSPLLCVGVFITSVISHLFGASVGREGAALQIGGSFAATASKLFRFDKTFSGILIRAGLAAVFSAVFGTPLTAFFFALEVVVVGTLHLKSAIPCAVSSITGFLIAHFLGAHAERFNLSSVPKFSLDVVLKIAVITLLTALLSIAFCHSLQASTKFAKRFLKNSYLRIIVGGCLVFLLTVLVGNQDYNGAGIAVVERIFQSGEFFGGAFAIKFIFTCICVAAGFKGGEIVPTLFIGATFGALLASLLDLPIAFGAALGMILLFCGVTNCPLASLFLSLELFSGVGVWYFIPTVAVCFLLSGKIGLYSSQKHKFKLI